MEYFNKTQYANFTAFKDKRCCPDIEKMISRDEVSYLKKLDIDMKARKLGITVEKYREMAM